MSVQVRRRREAAAFLASFVGAQGELLVDTTNNRVQVHDGVTVGGFPAAKLSEVVTTTRTGVADAAYTALPSDRTIAYTALTAARTVTLPAANAYPTGTQLLVVDETGQCGVSSPVSVVAAGSDLINGASAVAIALPYGYVAVESNGASRWTIVDQATASLAQQSSSAVAITGGAINGATLGATTAATIRGTVVSATTSLNLPSYTVAGLPAPGTPGRVVFCSNARMQTATAGTLEASGGGTGGLVSDNGTGWKIVGTNITAGCPGCGGGSGRGRRTPGPRPTRHHPGGERPRSRRRCECPNAGGAGRCLCKISRGCVPRQTFGACSRLSPQRARCSPAARPRGRPLGRCFRRRRHSSAAPSSSGRPRWARTRAPMRHAKRPGVSSPTVACRTTNGSTPTSRRTSGERHEACRLRVRGVIGVFPLDITAVLLPFVNEALHDLGLWAAAPALLLGIVVEIRRKLVAKDIEIATLRRQVEDLQDKRLQDAREMIRIAEAGTAATASRTQSDQRVADLMEAMLRQRPTLFGWRR